MNLDVLYKDDEFSSETSEESTSLYILELVNRNMIRFDKCSFKRRTFRSICSSDIENNFFFGHLFHYFFMYPHGNVIVWRIMSHIEFKNISLNVSKKLRGLWYYILACLYLHKVILHYFQIMFYVIIIKIINHCFWYIENDETCINWFFQMYF